MSETIHVAGFSGSLRTKSYNRALLRVAARVLPGDMSMDIVDLLPLPMYNPDFEAEGVPPAVTDFRAKLAAADAFLIACPEYNYSVTGALKNALDWASRTYPEVPSPLNGKPLAIMGIGGRLGTIRAQLHLREIAQHNDMHPLNKPTVALSGARNFFDDDLNLQDETVRDRIADLMSALRDWTVQLR